MLQPLWRWLLAGECKLIELIVAYMGSLAGAAVVWEVLYQEVEAGKF